MEARYFFNSEHLAKPVACIMTALVLSPLFHSTSFSQEKVDALPTRDMIERKYQWKLEDVFPSDESWEQEFARVKNRIPEYAQYKGRLGESGDNLLRGLKLDNEVGEILGKLSWYASRRNDENTADQIHQAQRERISSLYSEAGQASAFIGPEITAIPEARLLEFIKKTNGLEVYGHYLEDLQRSKAHILPPEQEELLAMAGDVTRSPAQIFSMFDNADITFPAIVDEDGNQVEVTKGRFFGFMQSADRRVRMDAFDAMYTEYNKWSNTLAAMLSSQVKRDIFYARARKYNSALESAIDAYNVPVAVYDNVVHSMSQNLDPLHRYVNLSKQMLKLDQLHPYDIYVPLLPQLQKEIPYDEAVQTVLEALKPLGPRYVEDLKAGLASGWIDVYENQGKRSGAYSSYTYGAHPVILLNYDNKLDDMFTLAHEIGHSMHSYYTGKTQPYVYADYTIFVAEVASTVNEALLMDHLLKTTTDRDEKLFLLNQYADNIRGTVYIQALFAEFEKTIHEKAEAGEALTADVFNAVIKDLYERYYGPDFIVDKPYELNWARIPHFYRTFYVYQYATGFAAAQSLAQKIIDGDTAARDRYLEFLASGSSDYSIDLLKKAGVDMTSPEPIVATARLMGLLVGEMEQLVKE